MQQQPSLAPPASRRSRLALSAVLAVAALLVFAVAVPAAAGGMDAADALAQLKALEGTWTGTAGGNPGVEIEYRVTGGGSVVMETQFPGSEHEMVSMYHLDGERLVMTHYCAAGNQPRLELDPAAGGDELTFVFAGGSNLDPAVDVHIHGARFRLAADGSMRQVWSSYRDGEPAHEMVFELQRAAD
jgi:hypothetical protein